MALSRFSVRSFKRAKNALPARRPSGVRVKNRNCFGSCKVSSPRSVSRCAIRVTFVMPSPPAGPVPARISLRTSCGSSAAITWAIMPPIEKPRRSTCSRPSARMKATASFAIASMVLGVEPLEAPTPRLSKVMTRCWAAMPSTTRGSQLSKHGGQVGEEDHRDAGLRAELAVGEVDTPGGDGAGRCVLVRRDHVAARRYRSSSCGPLVVVAVIVCSSLLKYDRTIIELRREGNVSLDTRRGVWPGTARNTRKRPGGGSSRPPVSV